MPRWRAACAAPTPLVSAAGVRPKPADAAVYIDGYFVGSAYDFGPDREPLLLRSGPYTLELRAEGFVTDKFPVYVTMGEVLPFSGSLVKSD